MIPNQEVAAELKKIHRGRNRVGVVPTLVTLLISIYIQQDVLLTGWLWIPTFLMLFIGCIIRVMMNELFFDHWLKNKQWSNVLMLTGMFLTSFSVGLHFFDIIIHFGPGSLNAAYFLLATAAFVMGASSSFVANKLIFYTYVLTMEGLSIMAYIYFNDPNYYYVIFFILIFLLFSISQYKLGRNQLIDLISAQKNFEKEASRLNKLINTVPGFVAILDKNLVCYMANQSTLELYPDVIGRKVGDIDPNSEWENFVKDFMISDKTSAVYEAHTLHQGEDLWALLNIQKNDDGGAIIVSILITELVKTRKTLREHEAKYQYSAKLASLGEMAAGIAHEINNPLTIILGSSAIMQNLLREDPIDKETVLQLGANIATTSERISRTIKSLRALSRNGAKDPMVAVSLKNLTEHCLDVCGSRFKNNDITLILPEFNQDIFVRGREVELGQVLLNLLSNAIDAVQDEKNKAVEISYLCSDKWIDLMISDTGRGVSSEIREKIMEPFFSTKEVNKGTGIGLSISKTIMESHNGELTLLDTGEKTTFRMRLPFFKEINFA